MSQNPYFVDLKPAIIEYDGEIYGGYTFNHTIYGAGFELRFEREEVYNEFAQKFVYGKRTSIGRFYFLNNIAGTTVKDRREVVAELLSHNSDYYKATFILK